MKPFQPLTRIVLVAALLTASACTGEKTATSTTTSLAPATTLPATTAPERQNPAEVKEQYLESIGDKPDGALENSDADLYGIYMQAVANVVSDPAPSTTVLGPTTTAVGSREVCAANRCVEITDISFDATTGQVSTFSVAGVPLKGRIVAGGDPAVHGKVTVSIVSAMRTRANKVIIVVEVANEGDRGVQLFPSASTYRNSVDSAAIEATGVWGDGNVPANGEAGMFIVELPTTELGGVLTVSGVDPNGNTLTFTLPTAVSP